jgi:hypothetical protein
LDRHKVTCSNEAQREAYQKCFLEYYYCAVKLPRGLKVRLERLLRWRLFGEWRKMLPAELR